MSAQYTPGWWAFDGVAIFTKGEDAPIAEVLKRAGMSPEERFANGYLIQASPDLLAACEALLATHGGTPTVEALYAARDMARAAIAKARGQ